MKKKNYQAPNRQVLENSVLCNLAKRTAGTILDFTTMVEQRAENFLRTFRNTQMIGIIAISAVLVNLALVYIMRLETQVEWVFLRCVVVVVFSPWIFCKRDLREIAGESKILKLFRTKNAKDQNTKNYRAS